MASTPKVKWTNGEIELLQRLVNAVGQTNLTPDAWATIATHFAKRNAKQCRERWMYHMRPDCTNGDWTTAEELKLFRLQKTEGNRWKDIAAKLPNRRSETSCKNRFYSAVRRIKRSFGITQHNGAVAMLHASDGELGLSAIKKPNGGLDLSLLSDETKSVVSQSTAVESIDTRGSSSALGTEDRHATSLADRFHPLVMALSAGMQPPTALAAAEGDDAAGAGIMGSLTSDAGHSSTSASSVRRDDATAERLVSPTNGVAGGRSVRTHRSGAAASFTVPHDSPDNGASKGSSTRRRRRAMFGDDDDNGNDDGDDDDDDDDDADDDHMVDDEDEYATAAGTQDRVVGRQARLSDGEDDDEARMGGRLMRVSPLHDGMDATMDGILGREGPELNTGSAGLGSPARQLGSASFDTTGNRWEDVVVEDNGRVGEHRPHAPLGSRGSIVDPSPAGLTAADALRCMSVGLAVGPGFRYSNNAAEFVPSSSSSAAAAGGRFPGRGADGDAQTAAAEARKNLAKAEAVRLLGGESIPSLLASLENSAAQTRELHRRGLELMTAANPTGALVEHDRLAQVAGTSLARLYEARDAASGRIIKRPRSIHELVPAEGTAYVNAQVHNLSAHASARQLNGALAAERSIADFRETQQHRSKRSAKRAALAVIREHAADDGCVSDAPGDVEDAGGGAATSSARESSSTSDSPAAASEAATRNAAVNAGLGWKASAGSVRGASFTASRQTRHRAGASGVANKATVDSDEDYEEAASSGDPQDKRDAHLGDTTERICATLDQLARTHVISGRIVFLDRGLHDLVGAGLPELLSAGAITPLDIVEQRVAAGLITPRCFGAQHPFALVDTRFDPRFALITPTAMLYTPTAESMQRAFRSVAAHHARAGDALGVAAGGFDEWAGPPESSTAWMPVTVKPFAVQAAGKAVLEPNR